jgi:hypothetical protein
LAASQADNTSTAASLAREQRQHSQTQAQLSALQASNTATASSLAREQQQHSGTKARLAAAEAAAADWEAKCASKEVVSTAFSRILSGAVDTANSAVDQIAASFADAQARANSNSAQLADISRQQAFFQASEALLVQQQEEAAQRINNLLQIIAQLQACAAQGDWAVQLLVIMVNSLQQQLVEAGQREASLCADNYQHISQLSEFRVKTRTVLREQHASRAASNTALQVLSIFLHNQQQQQQQQQVAAADSAASHKALDALSIFLHHQQQQQQNAAADSAAAAAAASRAGAQASTPVKQVQLHMTSSAADAAAVLSDQQQQQQQVVVSPFRLLSFLIPPSSSSLSRCNSLTRSSSSSSSSGSIASIRQLVMSSPYQHAPSAAAAQAPHTVVNVQHLQQQLSAAAASDAVTSRCRRRSRWLQTAAVMAAAAGVTAVTAAAAAMVAAVVAAGAASGLSGAASSWQRPRPASCTPCGLQAGLVPKASCCVGAAQLQTASLVVVCWQALCAGVGCRVYVLHECSLWCGFVAAAVCSYCCFWHAANACLEVVACVACVCV